MAIPLVDYANASSSLSIICDAAHLMLFRLFITELRSVSAQLTRYGKLYEDVSIPR